MVAHGEEIVVPGGDVMAHEEDVMAHGRHVVAHDEDEGSRWRCDGS